MKKWIVVWYSRYGSYAERFSSASEVNAFVDLLKNTINGVSGITVQTPSGVVLILTDLSLS